MKRVWQVLLSLSLGFVMVVMSAPPPVPALAAGSLTVDNRGTCHAKVAYLTIQDAVNHAVPGTNIKICPGDYAEQVVITGLSRLRLTAKKGVTLHPPAGALDGPVIQVNNSKLVKIQGLTIIGAPYYDAASTIVEGIELNNSSATISRNVITNMRQDPLGSDGTIGEGIVISNNAGKTSITRNVISGFQGFGIDIFGGGGAIQISSNTIVSNSSTGSDPWGIYLGGMTGVRVSSNTIKSGWNAATGDLSLGIFMDSSINNTVSHNKLSALDTAMTLSTDCTWSGRPANGNKLSGNTITGAPLGIDILAVITVDTACPPTMRNNSVTGNKIHTPVPNDPAYTPIHVEVDSDGLNDAIFIGNKVVHNTAYGFDYIGTIDGFVDFILNQMGPNRLGAPHPAHISAALANRIQSKLAAHSH